MRYYVALLCLVLGACSHDTLKTPEGDGGGGSDGGDPSDMSVIGVADGHVLFDPCVETPATGFDPVAQGLAACCDGTGPAHCVGKDQIISTLVDFLGACDDTSTVCMPDNIIQAGGTYKPQPCTSSFGSLEGACLSKCIPLVANNPQAVLLDQDDCKDGELCIPCKNPLDGTQTGACNLVELLCAATNPDGGTTMDGGTPLPCPYEGPPLIDPSGLPACDPVCGGAHCLPSTLVPAAQQSLLTQCNGGAGLCTPDKLIETAGNFVPKGCRSIGNSEGRCLSTCLAPVAAQAAILPVDICDSGEKCVPCYDPTHGGAATGACTLACDKPKEEPISLQCPYTGPDLVDPTAFPDCSPVCGGAHCVPAALVPDAQKAILATCDNGNGYCAPDKIVKTAGYKNPKTCKSVAGVTGRCMSKCLPDVAAQAAFLPQDKCDADELCAPCYNPLANNAPTGACSLPCDSPGDPPAPLACPYTGTPLVDPTKLPSCAPACNGAHCLPKSLVPTAQQALLAACDGGNGVCLPDSFIKTGGLTKPTRCNSIAGVKGRCLSICLPSVAEQADVLPSLGCGADQRCVPCYNPLAGDDYDVPTGACSVGCEDMPEAPPVKLECEYPANSPDIIDPTTLPDCAPACNGAHCLPSAFVPVDQQGLLSSCNAGKGFCAPDKMIESGNLRTPKTCTSIAGAEGRCLSTCLPSVAAQAGLLPQAVCDANERCVPCFNPLDNPTVETGACGTACMDAPAQPPVILSCQNHPSVISPSVFPACNPICAGAHCMPSDLVPPAQQSLLAKCTGGFCTPDLMIQYAGWQKPDTCDAFAGTPAKGRCLSACLPLVADQPSLEKSTCGANQKCAPCADPFTGAATGACELTCDTDPNPQYKFPKCCNNTSTCVTTTQLAANGTDPNADHGEWKDLCASGFRCVDDHLLPGQKPVYCHAEGNLIFGDYVGGCMNNCMLSGLEEFGLSVGSCPGGYQCAPCDQLPSGSKPSGCP